MSPRKKLKSSHPQASTDIVADGPSSSIPPATPDPVLIEDPPHPSVTPSLSKTSAQQKEGNKGTSRKWLGGGSWRSKAPPIVTTRKESIGSSQGTTLELQDDVSAKKAMKEDTPKKFLSKRKSSKGDALPASMTKLSVSSDGSVDQVADTGSDKQTEEIQEAPENLGPSQAEEPPLPPDPTKNEQTSATGSTFGWLSWWSRPDGYTETAKSKVVSGATSTEDAQETPLPGPTPSEEVVSPAKELNVVHVPEPQSESTIQAQDEERGDMNALEGPHAEMKDTPMANPVVPKSNQASSWFWSWSSAQNSQSSLPKGIPTVEIEEPRPADTPTVSTTEPAIHSHTEPSSQTTATDESALKSTSKPGGWAFWSKEKPNMNNSAKNGQHKQVGEVAVFDTPSQSHPEVAQFNEQEQPSECLQEPSHPPKAEPVAKRSFMSLRGRPKTKDTSKDQQPKPSTTLDPGASKSSTPSQMTPSQSPAPLDTAAVIQSAPTQATKTKFEPPNIILPEFKNTYRLVQKPTYWQQIRRYFLGGERAMPHLHVNPAPPRIKKAVAIGVHGYFPAPILQKVLGQPTGTSIRFANAARTAIENWTKSQGYSAEIEQIALEGEGFIAERVNTLWKLLLNWIDHIKSADFILVACHSQGVPVAIMLVAKLIQFGCLPACRIGICAMAGVNMGPFVEYKSKYLGATAVELFEFGNPKSLVSQMYLAALDEVLRHGVRVLYVGSIDDQLVSLESSTFSTLSHPYIYRAVFVDGRIHAPDFLTHLVGFALKLRNLGLPDHGLIRELSPALAGSLYGGEGHSRVYEDPRVYELAVQHALETTNLPIGPQQRPSTASSFAGINIPIPGAKIDEKDIYALRVKEYEAAGAVSQNPFFLPWAMRGLLEEDLVKKELGQEVEQLLSMFEHWQPTGKQLKDVKFRLEGVRSKL